MRFKFVAVLFVAFLLIFSYFQADSYAAEEWNLIAEISYDALGNPTSELYTMPKAIGDFNGDNIDDLAIGFEQQTTGAVYIMLGNGTSFSSTPSLSILGNDEVLFGYSLANIGDIDGDGIDDLMIGAPLEDTVYLLLGTLIRAQINSDGIINIANGDFVSLRIIGEEDSQFGATVASAGDMNANGRNEAIITEMATGKVDLFLGEYIRLKAKESNLIDLTAGDFANYTFIGSSNSGFGYRIGSAGDINGDGYGDMIITDPVSNAFQLTGSVYLYLGGPSINTQVDMVITGIPYVTISSGEYVDTFFGWTIATNFDIDNDGYDDIAVGAPESGPLGSGLTYLYFGSEITSQMIVRTNYSHSLDDYLTFYGEAEKDNYGADIVSLDADNDGYDDLAIGAPFAKDSGTGRVYFVRGKQRASLKNSVDNVIVGSFITADEKTAGEGAGFTLAAGEGMASLNKGDLYIFTFSSQKIYHCAVTQTPSNVLGGTISAAKGNNHLTAANSPYIVRDDIKIPYGETLTVDPGVIVKFNMIKFSTGGYSEDLLELNILGTLIAEGSVSGHGNEDIEFTLNTSTPSKGGWLGINIDDGGAAVIKKCSVGYGINGIWVDRSELTLENSTVFQNGGEFRSPSDCDESVSCDPPAGNGVYVKSGNIKSFKNNLVTYNQENGLIIESPENKDTDQKNVLKEISGNEFLYNGGSAINNGDGDLVVDKVSNNTVSFNGGDGITGFVKCVITENIVYNNDGNGITSVSKSIISKNSVELNETGIEASESSEIKDNITVNNYVGIAATGSIISNNYVGVRESGAQAPNAWGIVVTSRVEVSNNTVSYNYFDGLALDSNPAGSESPAIIWQNNISYNGENGILLFDASPKIYGNNIIYNGQRGVDKAANGIKSDNVSKPDVRYNNLFGNKDMALRLYHTAPVNLNETFTLEPVGNWWGTTALNEIYDIIWDSRDDDISILGEVIITAPAKAQIDVTEISKPSSGGSAASSILECFVATASYKDSYIRHSDRGNNIFDNCIEAIDNALFKGGK